MQRKKNNDDHGVFLATIDRDEHVARRGISSDLPEQMDDGGAIIGKGEWWFSKKREEGMAVEK